LLKNLNIRFIKRGSFFKRINFFCESLKPTAKNTFFCAFKNLEEFIFVAEQVLFKKGFKEASVLWLGCFFIKFKEATHQFRFKKRKPLKF